MKSHHSISRTAAMALLGICLALVAVSQVAAGPVTVAVANGSIITGAGTYAQSYQFLPYQWNITASDFIFEGQFNISDINAKAQWNTWDDNLLDATDKFRSPDMPLFPLKF